MKRKRGKVQWVPGSAPPGRGGRRAGGQPVNAVPKPTLPYVFPYLQGDADSGVELPATLSPGDLVVIRRGLWNVDTRYLDPRRESPPHPYLAEVGAPGMQVAGTGTTAVYLGSIRVEEGDGGVRRIRHKFLIAGGIYIIPGLSAIEVPQ